MITTPKPQNDMHNVAAYFITLPFIALTRGGSLAKSYFAKNAAKQAAFKQAQAASVAKQPAQPPVEPTQAAAPRVQTFGAATRVHSTIAGNLKLYFYEYNTPRVIKVTSRKDGVLKEAFFTPDIAIEACLAFSIDGALTWIRKRGFKGDPPANVAPMEKTRTQPVKAPPAPLVAPVATPLPAPAPSAAATSLSTKLSASNKRPFTGHIVEFGPTKRPGRDGKPEYTTYFIALENADIGRREFIGEQLAELVENHSLQVGMKVRLHSLGKQHFTVTVGDRAQERTRNEYAIDLL